MLDWQQEYSTLKNSKLDSKEQKKSSNPTKEMRNKVNCSEQNQEESKNSTISDDHFITISDGMISQIEEGYFNIFALEKEVGEKNILSTITCYAFSNMGFYSFINYSKFENFVHEISNGYDRKNPYHNVSS